MRSHPARAERTPAMANPTVLRAQDVWAGYPGTEVLRGIDLEVTAGDAPIGIVGPSGAGKTTLVRALAGELRPTRGTVTINGRIAHRLPRGERKHIRAAVRFTSQDSLTVTDPRLTVTRQITTALGEARKAGRSHGPPLPDLLAVLGLPPHFPTGRLAPLPGGGKQRVALPTSLPPRPDTFGL